MNDEIPHALTYEKSVLSTMLKEPEIYVSKAKVDGLTGEHFHSPAHRLLFERILAKPIEELELTQLVTEAHREGILDHFGGSSAISDIYTYAPNAAHWGSHVGKLHDYRARRRAVLAGQQIVEQAGSAEPGELARMLADAAKDAGDALKPGSRLVDAKAAVEALAEQMRVLSENRGELPGWATGMSPVDLATGGMRPGQLWVIAGETSGGKSVAMLQGADSVLASGGRVLVVSLEMEATECMARLASCRGRIDHDTFTKPGIARAEGVKRARSTLAELQKSNLAIDDAGGRSMDQIEAIASEYRDQNGGKLDLVIVDYIQLIESQRRYKSDTQATEIGDAVKAMKNMAKRLRCAVVTASQLNDDGRLFGARAIGHHADVVLRIKSDGVMGDKVRSGPRGQLFPLVLNGAHQRFDPKTNANNQ